uniref:Pol polyprotein n=1 Tax=Cajanus cajan TaxID=3821 RepID=A0A151S733_CAJCA|nr:Pol polyprotein [Cajanus cajan]
MPGIDANFIYHRLAIHKEAKPVSQRKRKVDGETREAIITKTQKLLNVSFIREVRDTTWLANMVLVKKSSGKWRMCVDYTDLNKACPKDSYPLSSIDRLVDGASGHALLSFLDAYSGLGRPYLPHPIAIPILYLAVAEGSISAIIVQEHKKVQTPIYFISRVLQDTEKWYQMIEKLALALVTAARCLRPYFQSHQVVVKTDYPIKQILRKLELARRMIAWSVELSKFGIKYESRGPLKAQCLADFVAKLTPTSAGEQQVWTLHVDGSSNSKGGGVGIILEGPNKVTLEQSLKFGFKVTNNQEEYEVLLAGLRLAHDLGARRVSWNSDSKLMISSFEEFTIHHVPREKNARADLLSKLANTNSPSLDDKVVNTSDSTNRLLVAIDYFTKWIEACLLAKITAENVHKFTWKSIICRFGISHSLVTDNGRQFIAQSFEDFLRELGVKHLPTSVEHPQTNGQPEATNKVILRELKKRLGRTKGQSVDELLSILWAYHCTPQSTTQETPYKLTYGADAMILVEVGETSH